MPKNPYYFLVLLILVTIVTNINTVNNRYNLDDHYVINEDKVASQDYGIDDIFTESYDEKKRAKDYRPIAKLTFYIEYVLLGEMNPHVSHFIQVILYALFIALVYLFQLRITTPMVAFSSTLLFALHPLHTEVVASLKNREEILAMTFALMSFFLYITYYQSKKILFLLLASGLYFLSILTKLSAFPFILIIPFYIFLFEKKSNDTFQHRKIAYISIALLAAFLIRYVVQINLVEGVREVRFNENPLVEYQNAVVRIKGVIYTVYYYAKLMLFPYPLRYYYGYNVLPILSPPIYTIILGTLIIISFIVFFKKTIKSNKVVAFYLFWLTVLIAPFLNVMINTGIIAERATFMPLLGFTTILAVILHKYLSKKIFLIFILIIGLIYGLLSFQRNRDWKSNLVLYNADSPYLADAIMPNEWYAKAARKEALLPENKSVKDSLLQLSIEKCTHVLTIQKHVGCYLNIGNIYMYDYNEIEKALLYYEKALVYFPDDERVLYELAYANMQLNNNAIAKEYFEKTIAIFPESYLSYYYLSQLLLKEGNFEEALKVNKKIRPLKPNEDYYYLNMGAYHNLNQNMDSVLYYYEIAIEKGNRDVALLNQLINYYEYNNNQSKVAYYKNILNNF